jgi:hypothetical protein
MKKHTDYLQKARNFFKAQSWAMLILETASGVLFGAVLKAAIGGDVAAWIAVLLGLFWLVFVAIKFISQKQFPTAIVDDLIAECHLDSANKELVRRNIVLGFLSESVTTLNGETCRLGNSEAHDLCRMTLDGSLQTVLAPLVHRPHEILGCIESKFSVFVGVFDYTQDDNGNSVHPNRFLCLRDDYSLIQEVDDGLMRDSRASGFRLSAQEAIRRAFNENRLNRADAEFGSCKLAVMVSPLPVVCDPTDVDGVILIFTNCGHQYPSDLEGTMKIYGQIVSNWRWHYDMCEVRITQMRSPEPDDAAGDTPDSVNTQSPVIS